MGKNKSTTSTKRTFTAEQRAAQAEYLRRYRARNPGKVRMWRRNYILAAAARLQAEAEAEGGADHGGN